MDLQLHVKPFFLQQLLGPVSLVVPLCSRISSAYPIFRLAAGPPCLPVSLGTKGS